MSRTAEVIFVGDAASLIRASEEAKKAVGGSTAAIEAAAQKQAAAQDKIRAAAVKSEQAMGKSVAKVGKDAVIGAAGVAAASVDMALKVEKATASIAVAGNVSTAVAAKIEAAFTATAGKAEWSAAKIGEAYAKVAGELGAVEGHALTSAQAMSVMHAAMALAEATGGELNATTEALGKVMQTYGLHTSQAAEASDILFTSSRLTGNSVESLVQTVDRIRGRLGALSPSLAESAGLMDVLAKRGVTGRLVMGALNGTFSTLIGGSKATTAAAKELGLQIFDQSGKFVGLKSVIAQLQPKMAGLTQETQLQYTKALFGASANKQMLSVIQAGPAAFQAATTAVAKHGTAEDAAAKQAETLRGKYEKLKSGLEDLAATFGTVLIPVLANLTTALGGSIHWLEKHETASKALAAVVVIVLGGAIGSFVAVKVAAFVGGIEKMMGVASALATRILMVLVPAFATAEGEIVAGTAATATAVDASLMGTGIGVVLVALAAAAYVLSQHWEEVMVGLEKATAAAANFVIGQINDIIKGVNELTSALSLGLVPAIGEVGKVEAGHESAAERSENEGESEGSPLDAPGRKGAQLNHRGTRTESIGKPLASLPHGDKAAFAQSLAAETGLPVNFISAWMNHEQGSSTVEGGNNWLNIETGLPGGGSGPHGASAQYAERQTPQGAAALEATWLKQNLPQLLHAHSAAEAVQILERSGYAESHYGNVSPASFLSAATTTGGGSGTLPSIESLTKKAPKHKAKTIIPNMTLWAEQHLGHFAESTGANTGPELDKLQAEFHTHAAAWCAEFATTAAMMGGANKAVRTASVATIRQWAGEGSHGYQKGVSHAPVKGSLMMFGNSHVGFVDSVNKGAGTVQLIEGNANGSGGVVKRTRNISEGDFATPKYKAETASMSKEFATIVSGEAKEHAAALKAQAALQTAGQAQLSKIIGAIHAGGVKELSTVVGGKHDVWLHHLEGTLSADHVAGLDKLVRELAAAHTKAATAMAAAVVAGVQKWGAEWAEAMATLKTSVGSLVQKAGEVWAKIALAAVKAGAPSSALKRKKGEDETESTRHSEEGNKEALEAAQKKVREAKGNENPEELKNAERELKRAEEAITRFAREQDEKKKESAITAEEEAIADGTAKYEAALNARLGLLEEMLAKGLVGWEQFAKQVNEVLAGSGVTYTPEKGAPAGPPPVLPPPPAPGEEGPVVIGERPEPKSHRASGGPVVPGLSYMVGEVGPETFTPSRAGSITPAGGPGGVGGGSGGPTINVYGDMVVPNKREAANLAQQLAHKLTYGAKG